MDIKMYEFKKVWSSPIIISLLCIFVFFNLFIIYDNSSIKANLNILSSIVDKYGYKINNKTLKSFKNVRDKELKKLNKITYSKTSKIYMSADELFSHGDAYSNVYTKEDMEFFVGSAIKEGYYLTASRIDSIYKEIEPIKIGEAEIEKYRLAGEAADTVRKEYKQFNKRFKELIKNGENKNLFFMGKNYQMHSLLFGTLFRCFIFEIIILSVLSTSYLMNYEFDNNTELLVYSTKKGRELIKDKFLAAMLSNLLITTIVISSGLLTYFSTFNYNGLWQVPISNYFMTEIRLPYMSKWNMNFIEYLALGITFIYILIWIFTEISFFISRYIKNSYIVFFTFVIVFSAALVIPKFIPKNTNAVFIGVFTPVLLSMNSSYWFMESGAFTTFKNYELITVMLWMILTAALSILAVKTFRKSDIS
jgi:hypothetical protein